MYSTCHTQKRIINVSNRLPVKLTLSDTAIVFQKSEGGLATCLGSVFSHYDNIWIGWPGADICETKKQAVREELQTGSLYPVFLSNEEILGFYEGFSNEILWPLCHYFPTFSVFNPEYWDDYVRVNRKFTDEILKFAKKDDIIWIHDYHLMLVPEMLRNVIPELTVGYFQHIPFPSYDIFKALPWKDKIIKGLLGADTVGFQTENDVNHFKEAVKQITGVEFTGSELKINNQVTHVQSYPISIDYKKYRDLALQNATKKIARKIKKQVNTNILISIDRLDYSKGIIQRLQAFELFLKQHPEYWEKVTYIHLIVPSRENVRSYRALKEEMNKLISDINGKYATMGWQPIHHYYRSLSPDMLSAIYKSADVALVTPLIDGMNLVCKEYVASNINRQGVLVLGESAGAARELNEALIINPNDVKAFASTICQAFMMPISERQERMTKMQKKIESSDIFNWAKNFLSKLSEVKGKQVQLPIRISPEIINKIDQHYSISSKRLILLDYDGTIVPFYKKPQEARPDKALLKILSDLCADDRNDIVIISGRDNVTLEKWLGHLPVKIVAEHGALLKESGNSWSNFTQLNNDWKEIVSNTFSIYSVKIPGTFVEEKAYSVAWHYRNTTCETMEQYVKEIVSQLTDKLVNKGLDILQGNKVIEIKSKMINKGKAALSLVSKKKYDFIMAIGDDKTDEDMFRALPEDTFTIKVGGEYSAATYFQPSYKEVNLLLKRISENNAAVLR